LHFRKTGQQDNKHQDISIMKILLVEDELKVASFIKKGLEEQTYVVDHANSGLVGKNLIIKNQYDLVILDVILPHINGFELCRQIRKDDEYVPILMLSALNSPDDKIKGLDAGADDYMSKPFNFSEFLARVRVLFRRAHQQHPETIITLADLELNRDSKTVTRSGKHITLTAKEYYLLEFLLINKNRVMSRAEIAENVWDASFENGTNIVDVYINYLRNKIDKNNTPKLLHTVVGMGYLMKE